MIRRMSAPVSESSLSLSVVVVREAAGDAAAVERLAERAFGPGRFARTAYRLREVAAPDWDLCFVARVSTLLVGANRMTPVRIGEAPALMLGPLTVDPAFRGRGIAAGLVVRSLEAARAAGHGLVMLVGDEPYYRRFGFARVPAGRIVMPGPVDAARVLWCELVAGAAGGAAGLVGARRGTVPRA
jgi:predicted N-acetyltransferase YhbS